MDTSELVEMEHGFWDAAGDGAYYLEHMHDEGRCLLAVGAMDKTSTAEAISRAESWSSHSFDDLEVHELADNAVVLTYAATGERPDADTYNALISTTYVRTNGSWKLLIHQQTPLMSTDG